MEHPKSFTVDELKAMGRDEVAAGFECSGNGRGRMQGFASNGRWTGVPLRKVLKEAGLKDDGHEVVFFGADHGEEETDFRQPKIKLDQAFGRSLTREMALVVRSDARLRAERRAVDETPGRAAAPARPGWYGVANVKWLSRIHVQRDPFLGKFQSRWYRTMREEKIDGETVWNETAVTHMRLKSVVARVTKEGGPHKVSGFVLNDGTPLRSVEVKVDNGAVAGGDARAGGRQVRVEALQLHVDGRHARRAHDRLARDRPRRLRAAGDAAGEEDVPRRQQPVPAQGDDRLAALRAVGSANTKLGVAKRAAGNKITAWRSRRPCGVIALVAGGCVLVRTSHTDF